jgi:valyl-tRNA synthetase
VIVHPDDARFAAAAGKPARLPLFDRSVRVRAHPSAKMEFGTGAAMICSYGDTTDIALFRELGLPEIQAVDTDGRMTAAAGPYQGLKVKEARARVIEDLRGRGLLRAQAPVVHKTPVCERSKTPIEFIPMEDLYLRQVEALPALRQRAEAMAFYPPRSKQLLLNWMDSVTIDWPISRRRYFHTEIPLWYCRACGETLVPPPGPYYQPWKDPAPFDACPKCGGRNFRGEERVFDTWMDSSNSNLVAGLFMKDDAFFRGTFPTHLRPQGRDIVRNWLYYTTLKSHYIMDREPFRRVLITGMGLDKHGRAMHKSAGNVIEPGPVLDRHGADAFRFWAASETNVGDDFRIDEQKIAGAKKFLSKLWNVARFISGFPMPAEPGPLRPADRWILAELDAVAADCWRGYRDYNPYGPATRCREFLWNVFAAHYVEMVKARAYRSDAAAAHTLHTGLRTVLLFLAPISPFATDHVWSSLYGGSVHRQRLPPAVESTAPAVTGQVVAFNASVWKAKKDAGKSLAEPIAGVVVPPELEPFAEELRAMHHLS